MTEFSEKIQVGVPYPHTRERCYVCFRPKSSCFCAAIPSIENLTHVLILQHVKERFHAFNTARIVRAALTNCELIVNQTVKLAKTELPLRQNVGVLYPGKESVLLSDLTPEQRPDQLVVIDGTWHHAKTLMRDLPVLQQLPRYRLEPESPSEYRIRKEPTQTSLSTVEATVQALRALEPSTTGFEQLLAAFRRMVDDQVQHPERSSRLRLRRRKRPVRPPVNIPSALIHNPEDVVVAYGETSFGRELRSKQGRTLIYWVAQRLCTGEVFECVLPPPIPLSSELLRHLDLTVDDFDSPSSIDEFRAAWHSFVRPTDTICTFNASTLRALASTGANIATGQSLKSVNIGYPRMTLDGVLNALRLTPRPVPQKGRAGRRLANAVAFAEYLHRLGSVTS